AELLAEEPHAGHERREPRDQVLLDGAIGLGDERPVRLALGGDVLEVAARDLARLLHERQQGGDGGDGHACTIPQGRAAHESEGPAPSSPRPCSQSMPRAMYCRPETAVAIPARTKMAVRSAAGAACGQTTPISTIVTEPSWKNVVALPMALGRTAIRSPL